jgi:hypothetical protein
MMTSTFCFTLQTISSLILHDSPYVIRDPIDHFPVYEPDAERLAAIKAAVEEVNSPLDAHYDASREVRSKGAAFYQFSADEEERQRQLNELKQTREETMRKREETGAFDVPVGLEPDLGAGPSEPQGVGQSRAQEKRKRDLEARRQAIEAKRRKKEAMAPTTASEPIPVLVSEDGGGTKRSTGHEVSQSVSSVGSRHPQPISAADDFLANLERDMINRR